MSTTQPICSNVTSFADGELSQEEADAFRAHLRDCSVCQDELVDAMAFQQRLSALRPPAETNLAPTDKHRRRRLQLLIGALSGLSVLGIGLLMGSTWVMGAACAVLWPLPYVFLRDQVRSTTRGRERQLVKAKRQLTDADRVFNLYMALAENTAELSDQEILADAAATVMNVTTEAERVRTILRQACRKASETPEDNNKK